MKCCDKCFENQTLRRIIRENDDRSDCDYCGATDVFTIEPAELYEPYAGVLGLYEPVQYGEHFNPKMNSDAIDVGEPLPRAIQEDWGLIFSDVRLDDVQQSKLLDAIRRGDGHFDHKNPPILSEDLWVSKDKRFFHVSENVLWEEFCYHIKHDRRFIIKTTGGFDPIADPRDWLPHYLAEIETTLPAGVLMYRARLNPRGQCDGPLPANKMDAPPQKCTKAGRANSPGIRVLYAAMEKETAMAEVRPEKGVQVTIANLTGKAELRLADLTTDMGIPDPFVYPGEQLKYLITRNAFLYSVNIAMSVPIRREDVDIDYIPTQYVAEIIKDAGYDGIIYRSSLAEGGKNIVIFSPDKIVIDDKTELFTVTGVSITYE